MISLKTATLTEMRLVIRKYRVYENGIYVQEIEDVSNQAVAMESKLPIMLTHAPGHMFITDFQDL